MSFILSGVLSDYKESERMPGELAVSMESIAEDCVLSGATNKRRRQRLLAVHARARNRTEGAFLKKERTQNSMDKGVWQLGRFLHALEPFTQANFIVRRLKQEQNAISRIVTRIHTHSRRPPLSPLPTMAKIATVFVLIGLLTSRSRRGTNRYSSSAWSPWFLSYLILLINDSRQPVRLRQRRKAERAGGSLKALTTWRQGSRRSWSGGLSRNVSANRHPNLSQGEFTTTWAERDAHVFLEEGGIRRRRSSPGRKKLCGLKPAAWTEAAGFIPQG